MPAQFRRIGFSNTPNMAVMAPMTTTREETDSSHHALLSFLFREDTSLTDRSVVKGRGIPDATIGDRHFHLVGGRALFQR